MTCARSRKIDSLALYETFSLSIFFSNGIEESFYKVWSLSILAINMIRQHSNTNQFLSISPRLSLFKRLAGQSLSVDHNSNYLELTLLRQSAAIEFFSLFTAMFSLFPGKFTKYHMADCFCSFNRLKNL